jgi:hypothetical protein
MRANFRMGVVLSGTWLASCAGQDTANDTSKHAASESAAAEGSEQASSRQALTLFPGSGSSGAGEPLGREIPPTTAHDCVDLGSGATSDELPATTCFFDEANPTQLAASLERRLEVVDDEEWHHIRLTFNPDFVDNTYGANAIGWGDTNEELAAAVPKPPKGMAGAPKPPKAGKGGHTFKDLLGSDHAEFKFITSSGDVATQFKLDYISEDASASSGYASAGVLGGDGKMIVGEPEWILGATSSLDRNLNGCDLSTFTTDSPVTDEDYTPNPDAAAWDFRVVYEAWVADAALGGETLDEVTIEYVHASPSKTVNTLIVVPGPCPPPVEVPPNPPTTSLPPATSLPPNDSAPDAGAPNTSVDAGEPSSPSPLPQVR